MNIKIFTTGGTFDKVYFDAKSDYTIGEPQIAEILRDANVSFDFDIESILRKDSLEITDKDRELIYEKVSSEPSQHILIIHGTDTMLQTADSLSSIPDKTIILVGAMQPARFRVTDAIFNTGFAIAAAQFRPAGVYVAMNGMLFTPGQAVKNSSEGRFEYL